MQRLLERSRYLMAIASLLMLLTALATLLWSIGLAVQLVGDLLDGGWKSGALVAELLGAVDLLLIATVQVVVAIGLWELFVGDLTVPDWMRVSSLKELKNTISELIVLVLAIKFVEKLIDSKEALDTLYYAGGVALVGLMLVALSRGSSATH